MLEILNRSFISFFFTGNLLQLSNIMHVNVLHTRFCTVLHALIYNLSQINFVYLYSN